MPFNKFTKALIAIAIMAMAIISPSLAQPKPASTGSFSFIQISDEHVPRRGTSATIKELYKPKSILLKPYGVTAPPPSFVMSTGDITDFGAKGNSWAALIKLHAPVPVPYYLALGNHDQTWGAITPEFTHCYRAPYYSFNNSAMHFVVLNSTGLQDPRPIIAPEMLEWLISDLGLIGTDTPVFVMIHHPLNSSEYSSRYETDRLLDMLRPYNIAALLVGHGHVAKYQRYSGVDMVESGSTWSVNPGYQVVSINNGILSIAYKRRGQKAAETAMLQKPLTPAKRYPVIEITNPIERSTITGPVMVSCTIAAEGRNITSAYVEIDGRDKTNLAQGVDGWSASIPTIKLTPGAHYLRVSFVDADGEVYNRSRSFYVDFGFPVVHWRAFTSAASKSTPAVTADSVYVGTNDNSLLAYSLNNGAMRWVCRTGGAVAGEPLVIDDRIYAGCEDGFLYCVSAASGTILWRFDAGDPIYSSPVSDGSSVYFGCRSGAFYSIDSVWGRREWRSTAATYNIESKPFLANGNIYFGAWDKFVYCLDATTGKLKWKCEGQGSAEGIDAARYSPADCGPVVTGGKVFAPDRKYRMSIIDASTGKLLTFVNNISAVALSADTSYIYLRGTDRKLKKIEPSGTVLWSVDVSMDDVPAPPVESDGVVYVCSKHGLTTAVSATDGTILWHYQATPSSYVLSSITASSGTAYINGTDGSLTAVGKL
ncbi:MAG: PQQ-binding-like beta-propeller repeat protein [Armatimonadota bacterium]|nr:PQQ-binding-like beta-propeller repeat protein [bacterium]